MPCVFRVLSAKVARLTVCFRRVSISQTAQVNSEMFLLFFRLCREVCYSALGLFTPCGIPQLCNIVSVCLIFPPCPRLHRNDTAVNVAIRMVCVSGVLFFFLFVNTG